LETIMMFRKVLLLVAVGLALLGFTSVGRCDALDDILKAKVIKVAVPQDFAPFGSAGPDLKPQGYATKSAQSVSVINSRATSVTRLKIHRSAFVGRIVLGRENYHRDMFRAQRTASRTSALSNQAACWSAFGTNATCRRPQPTSDD
jgi:hypothetical protein